MGRHSPGTSAARIARQPAQQADRDISARTFPGAQRGNSQKPQGGEHDRMERQRKQKHQHIAENYRLAAHLRDLGHAEGGFCNV